MQSGLHPAVGVAPHRVEGLPNQAHSDWLARSLEPHSLTPILDHPCSYPRRIRLRVQLVTRHRLRVQRTQPPQQGGASMVLSAGIRAPRRILGPTSSNPARRI